MTNAIFEQDENYLEELIKGIKDKINSEELSYETCLYLKGFRVYYTGLDMFNIKDVQVGVLQTSYK